MSTTKPTEYMEHSAKRKWNSLTAPNITTYESDDSAFSYLGLWSEASSANTRTTSDPLDIVTLNFTGSAIEVWGPTDTNSGYYMIVSQAHSMLDCETRTNSLIHIHVVTQ